MTFLGWTEIASFFTALIVVTRPAGGLLARIADNASPMRVPLLGTVERGLLRAAGIDPE